MSVFNKLTIEICVTCNYFQRRLDWMLSSILQQQGEVPRIIFNVAYPKNNGNPTTEDVCSFFKDKGLNIKETVYPDEQSIHLRGVVRNKQLAETDAEYVLFSDSDMVYDPLFFEDLQNQLLHTELKNETRCISSKRISLDKQYSKDYFNKVDDQTYPCVVDNVAELVSHWPIFKVSRSCGAGYFQLANVDNIRKNYNGIYVDPQKTRDERKYQRARSDRQFRHMIGGFVTITTKPQYHLNHERDNEEGCTHLTIQR